MKTFGLQMIARARTKTRKEEGTENEEGRTKEEQLWQEDVGRGRRRHGGGGGGCGEAGGGRRRRLRWTTGRESMPRKLQNVLLNQNYKNQTKIISELNSNYLRVHRLRPGRTFSRLASKSSLSSITASPFKFPFEHHVYRHELPAAAQ
eukprot:766332-Hanusia_phi.AAC.4